MNNKQTFLSIMKLPTTSEKNVLVTTQVCVESISRLHLNFTQPKFWFPYLFNVHSNTYIYIVDTRTLNKRSLFLKYVETIYPHWKRLFIRTYLNFSGKVTYQEAYQLVRNSSLSETSAKCTKELILKSNKV